jgi:hypothetical protein
MSGHREFERAVLGAPLVPPGRITNMANALRRGLAGAHRRSAPPPLQILEALFSQFDAPVLGVLVEIGVPDELSSPEIRRGSGGGHRHRPRQARTCPSLRRSPGLRDDHRAW